MVYYISLSEKSTIPSVPLFFQFLIVIRTKKQRGREIIRKDIKFIKYIRPPKICESNFKSISTISFDMDKIAISNSQIEIGFTIFAAWEEEIENKFLKKYWWSMLEPKVNQ